MVDLNMIEKPAFTGDYESTVLEQWKTCVSEANNISEKRNNANNFFIALNTALLAVVSFSFDLKSILLAIMGLVICFLWFCTINSYKELNRVKYNIVCEMEQYLPLAPFSCEWSRLNNTSKYVQLTKLEKVIPWLFILFHSASIVYSIVQEILMP